MIQITNQTRRKFLVSSMRGAAAIGVGAAIPDCFAQAASQSQPSNDRILVVVQMSGGNDGLNTVVPYANDDYYAARPKLALKPADVLKHDDHTAFHASLSGMQGLMQQGQLAVIHGVGYDQPNRSHFESMDIWHTCRRKDESRSDGWLGRFLDQRAGQATGGDVAALHLGDEAQPLAVTARRVRVPTVKQLSEFQLRGRDSQALRNLLANSETATAADRNALLAFLESSTAAALAASQRVTDASQDYQPKVPYPDTPLGQKLRVVAQLIDAGLSTQVYYVQLDGFDTHAQQLPTHAILLRQWSDAVSALVQDLTDHDHADRVCVMTFSEFGRRVAENASEGTDHGAAGPMFLCGGGLRPGMHGDLPKLDDLQQGDLRHSIDFRQVYAAVLESWLEVDPMPILGGVYSPIPVFA